MDIFNILALIGGLCLFLFGMNLMGEALERKAGSKLSTILSKMTTNRWLGFLTGLGVTAIIQSSSATTVMVVGFVNSGIMSLKQAIGVIMGSNVGTTVTAWILSLGAIDGESLFVQLLKPTSFTPILALVGIVFYMFVKNTKKKDIGMILLGFATLMFGMDAMSGAVSGLAEVPAFRNILLRFQNPVLGVLAGMVLTAVIQSSSASVGILQAFATTGQITFGAAIPIIMGQNIGTCVTALLSSVGTNKNARRAAVVHLCFNAIGTIVWLAIFWVIKALFAPALLQEVATEWGIAVCHSVFNIACTLLMLPMANLLEKLANRLIPDSGANQPEKTTALDERLLVTPAIALDQCRAVTAEMVHTTKTTLRLALSALDGCSDDLAKQIREGEDKTDRYEDMLGSYLIKISALQIGKAESATVTMLLKAIGDLERIADHSVNILESGEELGRKNLTLSANARRELGILTEAVGEIVELSFAAFLSGDPEAARTVEPLEQVIDDLKEAMRTRHMLRLQQGTCGIETGFIWSDLLTSLERISDHCSNLAGCVLDHAHGDLNLHETLDAIRTGGESYEKLYRHYLNKYRLG